MFYNADMNASQNTYDRKVQRLRLIGEIHQTIVLKPTVSLRGYDALSACLERHKCPTEDL